MIDDDDDDDGWRDSKCRSHPLINGCDKNLKSEICNLKSEI